MINRLRPLIIPGILAILVVVYMMAFIRPPTGIETLDGDDLVNQQYPLYSFIFDSIRNGQGLPMWSPYQYAGQSVVANPQSTIYYPLAWLMIPFGVPRTVGWLIALHLWLGAWGMTLFIRRLGATLPGALIGGMIYGFSGLLAAYLNVGHFNYLICQAWLPWIATAYLWSAKHRHWFWAALPGAALLGMCILTGYPPLLYYILVWLFVLWIYVSWQSLPANTANTVDSTFSQIFRAALIPLRPLIVIGIGGAILGAAMLLPVGQFTMHSTRTQSTKLTFDNSYALPGSQIITLLFPNFFGYPRLPDQGYWGLPFYGEVTAYLGILPLIAIFLAGRYRQRAPTILLVTFVGLGLVVSLGIDGGVFTTLYWLLPGYSLFRVPSHALYFMTIGAAGLTALLISELQSMDQAARSELLRPVTRWILPLLAAFAVIASLALVSYFTAHSTDKTPPWRVLYSGNVVGVALVMIGGTWVALRLWQSGQAGKHGALIVTALIILFDLWHFSQPLVTVSAVDVPPLWKTMSSVVPPSPDYRVMTIPTNIIWQAGVMYTHHLNANGYDPLVSDTYQRLLDAQNNNPVSPITRLLGVHYMVSDQPQDYYGDQVRLMTHQDGWYIYEVENPLPHTFIASQLEVTADDEAVREQLAAGKFDPQTTATVDHSVNCPATNTALNAQITNYAPNAVDINASGAGLLVLTDNYDPSWTVTVDNAPAELLRVDTTLRGVCLGDGPHQVRFEYHPTAFFAGVVISVTGWMTLIVFVILGGVIIRRSDARRNP